MMNFLTLGLVLTSLLTAGFFTPTPQNPTKPREDVIVKEGHRVVVVEYDKEDGNTKVLISPHDGKGFAGKVYDEMSERVEGVKEGVKEVSSSVADETGEVGNQEEGGLHIFRPRELVCDAYGKCKHKIASAFEKTKDAAAEKVKDNVADTAHKASGKVQEAKENVKDSPTKVSEKASAMKEGAAEKAKEAEESARMAKRQGKKKLGEIMRHAGEVLHEVFDYVAPPERVLPVAGVIHLIGFAAAYGMCVWITFSSNYVLAGALAKQQFAMVQSKIYPVYFKGMGCGVGMALLGYLQGTSRRSLPASVVAFQALNLASALAMILTNLVWLEPRATKVMLERMKKDKEEGTVKEAPATTTTNSTAQTAGRGSSTGQEVVAKSEIIVLSQALERLNSYSSFLNALTLLSLTWHLVHLSQRLNAAAC